MNIVETLRAGTSLIWFIILALGWRFVWRACRHTTGLKPVDAVIAATWLLSLNREAFAAVAEYDPGDGDATALCYVFALISGLLMAGAIVWARNDRR